ncbi:thiol-disulfide oxidoreductase DCC family protein [Nafulsella turpanensis]|uniref:thiol-disulfide oxidoreductase DCC family protein n=1 Tax=Nafulsella turpanensis TaxID=1265690 RepID=UPI00037D6F44|nr:thiol-disulfide oxidoreductase DCC family protein [Nafulsella turpanensis]
MEKTESGNSKNVLAKASGRDVVLFDGVCNLCNGAVDFILDRDPKGQLAFASLQSAAGQELLAYYNLSTENIESVVLLKDGKVYQKSTAALEIAGRLKGAWPLLKVFKIVPRPLRDAAYNFIGSNRYRFFGKREQCRMPTPEIRNRFLEGL